MTDPVVVPPGGEVDDRERRTARAAFGMGVVTALSRAFGFVRVLVVAAVLGTTYLGNTFQATNSVSNVLFELLAAGALSAVLVPTFVDLLDRGERAEAERLAGGLLGVALLGLGLIALAGVVAAPLLARLLTAGVDDPAIAAQQRDLATFLLRFFVPQVLLYAWGAVATAVLYAKRRLTVTAGAPIGNTVVMVGALLAFRAAVGDAAPLDLSLGERLLLALAGTGGVAAFVGLLVAAAGRSGFRLRPRRPRRDPALVRLLAHSAWGVLLHAGTGLLLGAALILGGSVEGGVVAYQVALVFFLAPYSILAQPIHTAILPDLARDAAGGAHEAFADALRRALDTMARLVVPVSAALVALALPAMRVAAFGEASGGAPLLAAPLAALAVGLYGYGAFLLLARAYYALGDSRTPAFVAVGSAAVGVAVMAIGAVLTHGTARIAILGAGHSVAYTVGALTLAVGLARRGYHGLAPRRLLVVGALSAAVAAGAWAGLRAFEPTGRLETAGALAAVLVAAAVVYTAAARQFAGGFRLLRPAGVEEQ